MEHLANLGGRMPSLAINYSLGKGICPESLWSCKSWASFLLIMSSICTGNFICVQPLNISNCKAIGLYIGWYSALDIDANVIGL